MTVLVTLYVVYGGWGVNMFCFYFAFAVSYPYSAQNHSPTLRSSAAYIAGNKQLIMYIYNINNNKNGVSYDE